MCVDKKIVFVLIIISGSFSEIFSDIQYKRQRGEGYYKCVSSNTNGLGNVWVTGRTIGFLWDSDEEDENNPPKIFGFLEAKGSVGFLSFASLSIESRIVSYPWDGKLQYGTLGGDLRFTIPNNKDLRLNGAGIEVGGFYRFIKDFPSIAGFRSEADGNGFSSEGFIMHGAVFEAKALYDFDLVSKVSRLPLKASVNLGLRLPGNRDYLEYSQYLFDAVVAYSSLDFDFFMEFNFEGFFNDSFKPKVFSFQNPGWNAPKRIKVAFIENPMYLTLGGKYRYESGISLFFAVPMLLSNGWGNDMITHEADPGTTDPFDPWYTKWRLVIQMSVPLRYRQTGSEMRRNFLLMKNRKGTTKIDIEERLKDSDKDEDEEDENRKRLEKIRKKRESIEKDSD